MGTKKKSSRKKKNKEPIEIDWNLFEVVEANAICSVGEGCKKYKEGKRHYHCKDVGCTQRGGIRWCAERVSNVETHQVAHKQMHQQIENEKKQQNETTTTVGI